MQWIPGDSNIRNVIKLIQLTLRLLVVVLKLQSVFKVRIHIMEIQVLSRNGRHYVRSVPNGRHLVKGPSCSKLVHQNEMDVVELRVDDILGRYHISQLLFLKSCEVQDA